MYLHQKQMNNKLFTLTYMETPNLAPWAPFSPKTIGPKTSIDNVNLYFVPGIIGVNIQKDWLTGTKL
jgi:hypothetical protein